MLHKFADTSIQRNSQGNTLQESRTNIIGRYGMLSFHYKLNETGGKEQRAIEIR